jgi:hypothetical protein
MESKMSEQSIGGTWPSIAGARLEQDIAAAARANVRNNSLRRGLWRTWLVFAALWTITTMVAQWYELTSRCWLLPSGAAEACFYHQDATFLRALAELTLPPLLVLVVGYWIARGFRPDFGGINKRAVIGVALMPVWIFWIVLSSAVGAEMKLTGLEYLIGVTIMPAVGVMVFGVVYLSLIRHKDAH